MQILEAATRKAQLPMHCNTHIVNNNDLREMSYLFQRLSVIIQLFNSVLIHDSFVPADENRTSSHSNF